ncbi:MAG: phytoene desaturase family protein [Desulfatibacillaceae bacterium]
MKHREYDVAIIGGGPNGLICAGYLARAGLSVVVCEARHETGGGLDTLEFAGFKYNPHAIYHMMAEIMPPFADFGLSARGLRFIYPEVQAAYVNKEGKPLIFYRDLDRTVDFLSANHGERDARNFRRMYEDFAEFSDKILIPCTYVPAQPPVEMVQALESADDDVGRRFNEVAEMTPMEMLEQYELSDPLKAAVLQLFSMWGLSPFEALGYIFPLYVYRMTQAAIVAGGSHRLSSAIHKFIIESGGTILDTAAVERVVMEGGKASGVVLHDGTEIRAKVVASTVDPQQNFLKFFGPDEIPGDLVAAAERWEWEHATLFGVHLALREHPVYAGSEMYPDVNKALVTHIGLYDTDQLLDHLDEVEAGELPEIPLGHTTCCSIWDPIQAPAGNATGRFECLVPFDQDWESIRFEYAERCIREWREVAPNVHPIHTFPYPPTFIEGKIKNMVRGSIKQGAYVPLQMGYFRPNESCSGVWTPVENFFVCGASVYPGGMIIGGPGYIGANIIAEELDVKKWWDEPEAVKKARESGIIAD